MDGFAVVADKFGARSSDLSIVLFGKHVARTVVVTLATSIVPDE